MRRISKVAVAATAGGTLALGGIAVAVPVLAGQGGPGGRPAAQSQSVGLGGAQDGCGPGRADAAGASGGSCLNVPAQNANVTEAQKTALAQMAEEEKLAHDLYAAFAAHYDLRVFDQIAAAETQHLTAIRTLLDRYAVTDLTAGKSAGEFAATDIQATYNRLLAQGSASEQAALQAGVTVEKADIAALGKAGEGLAADDIEQVYGNLLNGSQRHLAAFQAWLD